jgi:hypothetical protein
MIGLCGVVASAGILLLTNAYRVARASTVTPFEYTGILWAPLWGFLFFNEVPRTTTVAGAAVIVVAGLIALRVAKSDGSTESDPERPFDADGTSVLESKAIAQARSAGSNSTKEHRHDASD